MVDVKLLCFMWLSNGTECSETSAYKIQTPGELPRRKHTTFTTRRKFETKNTWGMLVLQIGCMFPIILPPIV
jgi:hypothetical protein